MLKTDLLYGIITTSQYNDEPGRQTRARTIGINASGSSTAGSGIRRSTYSNSVGCRLNLDFEPRSAPVNSALYPRHLAPNSSQMSSTYCFRKRTASVKPNCALSALSATAWKSFQG